MVLSYVLHGTVGRPTEIKLFIKCNLLSIISKVSIGSFMFFVVMAVSGSVKIKRYHIITLNIVMIVRTHV